MVLMGLTAGAQNYVGTLEVSGYTRRDVEVNLAKTPQGKAVLKMFKVKFARMMPVKMDVDIPDVTLQHGTIKGDGITPVSDGKPYEKFCATKLDGKADVRQLSFSCMMGDKPVKFSGKRKK